MLLNKTSKKASRDTNEQNSEYQRLLKSDLDDTASVEHECHYQKLLSRLFFFSPDFFFSCSVNVFQGHDCKISKVIACNERALDPIHMLYFI